MAFCVECEAPRGMSVEQRRSGTYAAILFDGTWAEYDARRSKRLRKGDNRIAEKIKRHSEDVSVKFYFYPAWPEQVLDEVHDAISSIVIQSWKGRDTDISLVKRARQPA